MPPKKLPPSSLADGRPYFHGTCLKAAVTSLTAGNPLAPLRPVGSSKYARSVEGAVYLSPSFIQAAEYGWMSDRADWPSLDGNAFAEVPHVFEFRLEGISVVPEEDETGYAVKAALCRAAGKPHEGNMNHEFASLLFDAPHVLERLASIANERLAGTALASKLERPDFISGRDKTAIGRRLLGKLDAETTDELVRLGISVAVHVPVQPVAGYAMPRRVMRPEDAEPIRISVPEECQQIGSAEVLRP